MTTKTLVQKTKAVKQNQEKIIGSSDIHGWLNQLAHAGTEVALGVLRKFIQEEENEDLRGYAEIAQEEAEFNYYSPQNEQEEADFLLARTISHRQENLWGLEGKADSARLELRELDLNRKAHQKLMASLTDKEKIDSWKYNFSEDYYFMIKQRVEELDEEIAYETAWLEQARQLVKTKKYQTPPVHIFDHIHFDEDYYSIREDELEDDKTEENHDCYKNYNNVNII